jgi:hypothetical protein
MKQPANPVAKELKAQIEAALAASEREIARAQRAIQAGRRAIVLEERQAVGRISSEP